jgi:hypothetical protein
MYHIFVYIASILVLLEGVPMVIPIAIIISPHLDFLSLREERLRMPSHAFRCKGPSPCPDRVPPHNHPPNVASLAAGRYGKRC